MLRFLFRLLLVVVVVLFARTAEAQLLSPGPLSKGHASLEGDQNCNRCHSSGKRVEPANCLACHNDLGARINAGAGLHGRAYRGKPCEQCHVEHHGVNNRLIRWPGGDQNSFNHADEGWALQGKHAQQTCNKCHNRANGRGAPTFLGLTSACTTCHQDVHQGRFGGLCTQCHNENGWRDLKITNFNHELARFKLRGAHTKVQCAECHGEPPRYSNLKFQLCGDCHSDPHKGRLGPQCAGCHNEAAWKPATLKAGSHPGVSLGNGHASVGCKTCHDRGVLAAPTKGTDCVACHKAVHKAPFGNTCEKCHASILWTGLPASIGYGVHNRTAYPLTGQHGSVGCTSCHKTNISPRGARYRGLKFEKCADCHADQHKGEFAKSEFGSECRKCHSTAGFRPTLFSNQLHAKTAFPLQGKHNATACSACHKTERPRVSLHVEQKNCEECHKNPHGDTYAKEMADGGCAHCHKPAGWDLPKFEHAMWPLTGAHASARCESCHSPSPEDRKKGSGPSWKGSPTECAGCHDDEHEGQFRASEPKIADCATCHTTALFKIPKFDHTKQTKYPLTGEHAELTCERCHKPEKLKNGDTTTRWRLTSTECSFCHADPHKKVSMQ